MASTAGQDAPAALDLDRGRAALGEEAARVLDGSRGLGLVGEEGHVADDERALGGARDGPRMADHRIHRGGERVRLAVDGHLDRVADEQDVDAGGVEQRGRRGVVGGHHRDPLETLGGDDLGNGEGFGTISRQDSTSSRSFPLGRRPRRSGIAADQGDGRIIRRSCEPLLSEPRKAGGDGLGSFETARDHVRETVGDAAPGGSPMVLVQNRRHRVGAVGGETRAGP